MGRERRQAQAGRTVVAVGLTGGIGAGKSTALNLFGKKGAVAFSADGLVHELYQRSEVGTLVAKHFGEEVLTPEGTVDRGRLAEMVQGKPEELRWLEEAVHPLVHDEVVRRIQAAPSGSVLVCEVPLLFETGFESLFDLVVTIEASPEIRRRRSVHEFGAEQFAEFEALQASSERRTAESDLVFVNDGDVAALADFVDLAYEKASQLLPAGSSTQPPPAVQGGVAE